LHPYIASAGDLLPVKESGVPNDEAMSVRWRVLRQARVAKAEEKGRAERDPVDSCE